MGRRLKHKKSTAVFEHDSQRMISAPGDLLNDRRAGFRRAALEQDDEQEGFDGRIVGLERGSGSQVGEGFSLARD
jgi:hypothetical protein